MYDYEIVISIITMLLLGAFSVYFAVASVAGAACEIGLMWTGIIFMVFLMGVVLYNLYASE